MDIFGTEIFAWLAQLAALSMSAKTMIFVITYELHNGEVINEKSPRTLPPLLRSLCRLSYWSDVIRTQIDWKSTLRYYIAPIATI